MGFGIFDAIGAITKMAEDPNLAIAAQEFTKAVAQFPKQLEEINARLALINRVLHAMHNLIRDENGISRLEKIELRLIEISLGLDAVTDPVKRPPFHAEDVQAALNGEWPPAQALDCTHLTLPQTERTDIDAR